MPAGFRELVFYINVGELVTGSLSAMVAGYGVRDLVPWLLGVSEKGIKHTQISYPFPWYGA